jgi:hypothetical protein
MEASPFTTRPAHHGDSDETGGESFEMPKFNMGDYDTSGLMNDLSLSDSPGIRRNYEESNLLDDDSYEFEMRQARRGSGDHEDHSMVDDADIGEGEEDQTIIRATDAPAGTSPSDGAAGSHSGKNGGTHPSADAQRDERLKAALFELKKMNSVFENYASALEAARHHNEVSVAENFRKIELKRTVKQRLARRTAQTSQLLDQYVALVSQTEHTQRLILDKRWTGVTDVSAQSESSKASKLIGNLNIQDNRLAEEEERMRIEAEYRQQQEEELNRQRELELQQQREREREAKERAAALSSNPTSSGPRSGASRLGLGRGTRGTAVLGTRGSARGRGKHEYDPAVQAVLICRAVGSGVARTASSSVPATATANSSGIRKPSGSFANVRSSGYGPPRTRQ